MTTLEERVNKIEGELIKKRDHDFDEDYKLKIYEAYRNRIQHEDNLINQRISYLLVSQSFLLGPYVVSFTVNKQNVSDPQALYYLQLIVPVIGLAACLVTLAGIWAAVRAIRLARLNYGTLGEKLMLDCMPESKGNNFVPHLHSPRRIHYFGLVPPFGFAILLIIVWGIFLLGVHPFKGIAVTLSFIVGILFCVTVIVAIIWSLGYVKGRKTERDLSILQS